MKASRLRRKFNIRMKTLKRNGWDSHLVDRNRRGGYAVFFHQNNDGRVLIMTEKSMALTGHGTGIEIPVKMSDVM